MTSVLDVVRQVLVNVPNVFLGISGMVLPAPNVLAGTALNVILLVQITFVPLAYLVSMCPMEMGFASGVWEENGHPLGLLRILNARVTFQHFLAISYHLHRL